MKNKFETPEDLRKFCKETGLDYEIQYAEDEYGYFVEDDYSDLEDIWKKTSHRVIIIVKEKYSF